MAVRPRPRRRPRATTTSVLVAATALALGLATACSPVVGDPAQGGERAGTTRVVPALSEVTAAEDPRAFEGVVDVSLPDAGVTPVAEDPAPVLPAEVVDAQGTTVRVTDTSRILALDVYGTLSRTVFELGLGDRVVGRDVSSGFPEIADLPLVTRDGHELNAEAILALDPTVVLTDTSLGPWNVVLQLREAGVPVVVVDSRRGLDNLGSLTQEVADALGVPDPGRRLAQRLEREVAATREQVADVAPEAVGDQLRTVFLYARGQAGVFYLFGEDSGADALIEAVGGYDVAAEIGWDGMKPLNDEALVAAQPDVVLMMTKGLESVDGVDGLLDRFPSLAATPAGEHRRVVTMDDTQILSFGPRTSEVLNALTVALYAPEAL